MLPLFHLARPFVAAALLVGFVWWIGNGGTAQAATLHGATSRPTYSVYVRGETVTLRFDVAALKPEERPTLHVAVADADDRALLSRDLAVTPDSTGNWSATLPAPSDRLGFYRVTARLSSGETLPAVGSRPAGYFSYLVVVDPKLRAQPGEAAHFGMQGGFTSAFDARPYLGVHWVLGGYKWADYEPDHPGQFAEKRATNTDGPASERTAERSKGILRLPTLLNGTPKWALADAGKSGFTTGVIKDLDAWRAYCQSVGRARTEDEPELKRHIYQITWEPVYPWGFPTDNPDDIVRSFATAYPALHKADPKAFVIGPTGAGISPGDLAWNERLLAHALGRYIDGFGIHPYSGEPPEPNHLPANIRALKALIRRYAGRDLPLWGTEQGWATKADAASESPQATWLTRTYLIMLGEGFETNFAFYFADYPGEPGYGFFHNLNQEKIPFGTDQVSPKPVAGAYAALTWLLENHVSAGPIEWLGGTALGYAYERRDRPSEVTLALWDWGATPRPVSLPVGARQVTVFDWMGNARTVATPTGILSLTLGPAPQYVRGVDTRLWGRAEQRPLTVSPAEVAVFPGQTVTLTARVIGQTKGTKLIVAPPAEWKRADEMRTLTAATDAVSLRVPADAPFGTFPARVNLERGGSLVGLAAARVRVREPFAVERVTPGGGKTLRLRLRNYRPQAVRVRLGLTLRGVPGGSRNVEAALPASGVTEVAADFPTAPIDATRAYLLDTTLSVGGGPAVESTHRATFFAVPAVVGQAGQPLPAGRWEGVPTLTLSGPDRVIREPKLYHGDADLSATIQAAWDANAFYLRVRVRDDVHLQAQTGFDTWKQDCLQLAFDPAPGREQQGTGNQVAEAGARTNSEITLALTPSGPQAYRTIAPGGGGLPVALLPPAALPLRVSRDGDITTYEAAIPWRELYRNTPPRAGDVLGFAMTINDADTPDQLEPKALGLFGGITPTKDPSQFGTVVLTPHP
jgi:hypothetical protein